MESAFKVNNRQEIFRSWDEADSYFSPHVDALRQNINRYYNAMTRNGFHSNIFLKFNTCDIPICIFV